MRRDSRIITLALVLLTFSATESLAMYVPNPAARWEANRFFFAGDLQYTGDKDLDPRGEIEDEVGVYFRPSYAFAPNATIYGRIGFQNADHLDTGFAIGGGLQAAWVLPQARDWAIGGAFDVLYWNTDANNGGDVESTEVQLSPAVSYSIPQARMFTPYAGLAVDFLTDDLDEDDPVGLFFGSNIDLSDRVRLDAQFRVIHEDGFSLSAGYLF